jgi:hypothetical protein
MHCLDGRIIKPELLDTLPEEHARASLADLIRINRDWGGHSTLLKLLREIVRPDESFSLLDVGAASGDMGSRIREWYSNARVISLDRIPSHLAACPGERIAGDAFHIPCKSAAVDFVFSSLFLHHFTNDEIVQLLQEFARVAKRAVLVIDLERNPIAYYFLPWSKRLLHWDPVTVNDGAISVEAAFKPRELESLAARAGLANPKAHSYWPAFRIAMSASVS